MRVKDLISQLQFDYSPDREIYVAYWDKEIVEEFTNSNLRPDQWSECVTLLEASERVGDVAFDVIIETVEAVVTQPVGLDPL